MGGEAKEAAGTLTGDDKLKNEGKGQNLGGKVAGAAQSVTDSVGGALQGAKEAVTGKK